MGTILIPVNDVSEDQKNTTGHEENIGKAFVKDNGEATFVCPACQNVKLATVGHFRERQHRLKVKCSCSHVFKVNLEFRQCFRKPTQLTGTYHMHSPAVGGGHARICNLSRNGLCFEVRGIHTLSKGQKGQMDFTLDDKKLTKLHKEFIIRAVNGNKIGGEFLQQAAFEKELGFYLRF